MCQGMLIHAVISKLNEGETYLKISQAIEFIIRFIYKNIILFSKFDYRNGKEIDLDLDGEGGRTFLRVLLFLIMHDYPSLVTGALHLLFRHFSQRQEVLQAFKQVSS